MANEQSVDALPAAEAKPPASHPHVVGIGASAGGLGALRTLFGTMPREADFACVVVVHLSPEHESHLVELLQPYTTKRVRQVRSTVKLERNTVYVIPPNANLNAIDTHLRLSELESRRVERAPIDHFFRTLARAHDGRAFAVILTGSGSDGSLGLRRIKECGGVTIVQDPEEAEYDSMPRSAIQTGTVDFVLKLRDISDTIVSMCATHPRVAVGDEADDPDEHASLDAIVKLLRERTQHDFKTFRRSVLLRRIRRRMRLHRVEALTSYLDLLHALEDEPRALCNDLLFTVTEFFGDPDLFAGIEADVLPALFAQKTAAAGSRMRVWSIGCSTGEEAYSLAMLLLDAAEGHPDAPQLQVFASDLSPGSLVQARNGVYPHEIAADVSASRLAKYFVEQRHSYRVAEPIREIVLFAEHNVLRDPPYSRIDLILCRNLLSELQPAMRRAILAMFHYALEPNGRLIVGPRDAVDEPLLFEYEDRSMRVLKPLRGLVQPLALVPYWQLSPDAAEHAPRARPRTPAELASIHYRLMERYTPPSLLLDRDDNVIHYSAAIGQYVRMPGGEPTRDVHRLLCAPLPSVLQGMLERARREGSPGNSEPFTVQTDSGPKRVTIHVEPPLPGADLALIVIEEVTEAGDGPAPAKLVAALQSDLDRIHHRLRLVVEEHAEDRLSLEGANEQLESSNEELRFILEQLESSKEEIQAANEELTTLDIENRRRVNELGRLSGYLRHLLESTGLATLFVDRDQKIVRFTPQLAAIFNVRELDIGRPLADITHGLDYPELTDDAVRAIERCTSVDREVRGTEKRWYLLRMQPYLSPGQHVEGAVLTFIDITDRKRAEEDLREADRRKDEFLALLAHELRNPLAPIVSGIDLLRQAKDKPQLLDQITATMGRQAAQLVRLVDDLLELSRVSGGRLRLRKARVSLGEVVRDAVASVRPIVERQRHELNLELPDEPIELEADSARLTQVFANLLTNAARYTPEGGRISINAARESQEAVVTVIDNGIGIPAPAIGRVFEMFYQGDEARPARGGGLGIGLTLARSLVEMHGGTITAASAGSGRGSQFTVRLPVANHAGAANLEQRQDAPSAPGGHRVLIVDDNVDAARTLGMLVETLGQNEVHVANSGSDALRIAEKCRPDIVLLDLKMPGMDGYEVARRLRSESWGRELTLVAVTGWALEEHKRRSRDAGFDRHLTKPADIAALTAVLSSAAQTPSTARSAPPAASG